MMHYLLQAVHDIPLHKAALTGASGAAVTITAAAIDPAQIEAWLRVATLVVGVLTGIGSGGLVFLKYWDRFHEGKDHEDAQMD